MSKRFRISFEELEESIPEQEVNIKTLIDVNDLIQENNKNTEDLNSATECIITLDSLADVLSQSLDSNGLSSTGAKLTYISLDSIDRQVGIYKQNKISIENFNKTSDRNKNTNLAIETVTDKIVMVFKAIVVAIRKGIEWLLKFIRSIFNKIAGYKDKIRALRLDLVKVPTDEAVKNVFNNESSIKNLVIDGKEEVITGITDFSSFLKTYFEYNSNQGKILVKNILDIITVIPDGNVDEAIKKTYNFSKLSGLKEGVVDGKKAKNDKVDSYYSEHTFPGNTKILAFLPKSNLEQEDWDTAVNGSELLVFKADIEFKKELPVLSKQEITKLLEILEHLCNIFESSKKEYNSFISDKKSMSDNLDRKINGFTTKETNADKGSYIKSLTARLRMIDNFYINGTVNVNQYTFKVLESAISYCDFSIKSYSKQIASDKPEDK